MQRFGKYFKFPWMILWVFSAYFIGIWKFSVPLTGDQKVYINHSMEMWLSGNWIYPSLFGQHSYYKPPFQYWLTLIGCNVFGFNLFGTMIFSVIFASITAWI